MSLVKNENGIDVPLTPEEEAAVLALWEAGNQKIEAKRVEKQRQDVIDATIDTDTQIQQLKAMTSDEFDTWWSANVTTLAQANNVLKRIARVVIRRVL